MKKIIFLVFCLVLSFFCTNKVLAFSGGSGSSGDPWQISSVSDLVEIRNYQGTSSTGKYFSLTTDLDLNVSPYNTGVGWIPIGNSTLTFRGTFNGNDHIIDNLYMSTSSDYSGLFGNVTAATINNIHLTNIRISANDYAGGLIGLGSVTSTNASTSGTVTSTGAGGSGAVGGFIGYLSGGTIWGCSSSVKVVNETSGGNTMYTGGFVGYFSAGTVTSSFATGNVTSNYWRVGGFVGAMYTGTTVTSSYATGAVSARGYVGGFAGVLSAGSARDSYATGSVISTTTDSGTASGSAGGFLGFSQSYASVYTSYSTGNVTGPFTCGGFAGYTENITIQNSYESGAVSCGTSSVGGFIGYAWLPTTISYSYARGAVSNSGSTVRGFRGDGNTTAGYTANFWDTQTTGQSTAQASMATGTTSLLMKTQSTFTDMGWNFSSTWAIDSGATINSGYPYLLAASSDTTAPTSTSFFPTDNATSVSSTANLVLNFSEAVTASSSGYITIYNSSDNSVFERIQASSSTLVSGSGTTQIIINPTASFTSEASYYVLASSTAFYDSANNAYAGISATTTWNFTIVAAPVETTTDSSTSNTPSTAMIAPPATIGNGAANYWVGMGQTAPIDISPVEGANTVMLLQSTVSFLTIPTSKTILETHHITITDTDLYKKIITIKIASEPITATLALGETKLIDLDNDQIPDITISFVNVQTNYTEITVKNTKRKKTLSQNTIEAAKVFDENESKEIQKFTRNLSSGMRGNDVQTLQVFLNNQGFVLAENGIGAPGNETNYFGEMTKNALIKFQQVNQLPAFGYFGDLTRKFVNDQAVVEPEITLEKIETTPIESTTEVAKITPPTNNPDDNSLFPRDLSRGMFGEDVKLLQAYLNKNGFLVAPDGDGALGQETTFFGESTRLALVQFQLKHKLPANGYFGPFTRRLIQK